MKMPTNRRSTAAPDPIIAAIDRYCLAESAAIRASDASDARAERRASARARKAFDAVTSTPAVTLAGPIAKLRLHRQWLKDEGMGERAVLDSAIADLERLTGGASLP